jgi:hypothetical protein
MLQRCLELKKPIQRFVRHLKYTENASSTLGSIAYNPLTDSLTEDEWDEVVELTKFLQFPYK